LLVRTLAMVTGLNRTKLATANDLRKLVGNDHLAGLAPDQIVVLIHEARSALRETGGSLAQAADAVRRLAERMRGAG
jgi:hypothetical protein